MNENKHSRRGIPKPLNQPAVYRKHLAENYPPRCASSNTTFQRAIIPRSQHKHRRINFFPAGRRDVGKQKAMEPRPKGRRNALRYGSERETLVSRGWVGWAPSDGHGHDRGGYGRPGRDIELVAREDGQRASIRLLQKRTLSLPTPPHALPPPVLPPAPPPRGAPTSLPSRALSPLPGEPRETESSERERERKDEKELAEGGGWVAGSTGLQPRDTTGQRDTLVYSISPSRVHTRFPRAIIRAATR